MARASHGDKKSALGHLSEALRVAQQAVQAAQAAATARGVSDEGAQRGNDGDGDGDGTSTGRDDNGDRREGEGDRMIGLGDELDAGEVAALVASTANTRDVLLARAESSASVVGGDTADRVPADGRMHTAASMKELNAVRAGEEAMKKVRCGCCVWLCGCVAVWLPASCNAHLCAPTAAAKCGFPVGSRRRP